MGKRGRPRKAPKPIDVLKEIIPVKDLFNDEELYIYNKIIEIYIQDFDETDDLSASDVDDIMSLGINKILELRLLKESKNDVTRHLDVSAAIEKLRKQNDKIKDNLLARRKDRIDPNENKSLSIIHLASIFDEKQKKKLEQKVIDKKNNQIEIEEKLLKYGNKNDKDL